MSYWKKQNECDYCGKPFESTRKDAKFCPNSKCKTAYHRRKKKREAAMVGIADNWTIEDRRLLNEITDNVPNVQNMVLDMYSQNGSTATANAIQLASMIMEIVTFEMDNKIKHKDQEIEALDAQVIVLELVRNLVNTDP